MRGMMGERYIGIGEGPRNQLIRKAEARMGMHRPQFFPIMLSIRLLPAK